MRSRDNHRWNWLTLGLCFALLFPLGSGVIEAKKGEDDGKCDGTKQQRKQRMKEREITLEQLEEMIEQYEKDSWAEYKRWSEIVLRRMESEYAKHKATGEPFVYDMLVISGGGAKGAFGAGFFEAWGKIESGPYARPVFDMVTGVSTGALLAPFAFVGNDKAYSLASEFYWNPQTNWVRKRGMLAFLPGNISMTNNCHLHDTVREAMDRSMLESLAEAAEEDRLLLIGATNLDIGAGRAFDLGQAAQRSLEEESPRRVADILLASSSLPGAFPPILIDGMLYADGGATSNVFVVNFPGPEGPIVRFEKNHPGAPLPKIRVWVVVNQHLKPRHVVTQPKWIQVSSRALATLTSTSQLFALNLIRDMVHDARTERGLDTELYLVSIPDDAPKKKTKGMFDEEYMRALQEFGRKMGADPSHWTTEIPSAYRVEGEWGSED